MADIKWIKIATDIFDDEKILLIESMPDADSIIVIWFKLLTLAGKQNNNGIFLMNNTFPYTDEMLATIFRRPLNTVRLALETFEGFGMIEVIENTITIPKWEYHQNVEALDKIREQTKKRVAKHRAKQKLLADVTDVTENVTLRNATDKNRKEKKRIDEIRREEDEIHPLHLQTIDDDGGIYDKSTTDIINNIIEEENNRLPNNWEDMTYEERLEWQNSR